MIHFANHKSESNSSPDVTSIQNTCQCDVTGIGYKYTASLHEHWEHQYLVSRAHPGVLGGFIIFRLD